MAKLAREGRLRERRVEKQARKVARKHAAAQDPPPPDAQLLGDLADGEPTPGDG